MFAVSYSNMGTAERKAKEKEELKELILNAAKKLFVEKGVEQTKIRNIAESINYSVGTVYVYYKDKNSILHDLHTLGFKQLGGEMRILFAVADPMERLKALGRVYISFALNNPEMYDLMFIMKAPMEFLEAAHKDEWDEGRNTFDVLRRTVGECIDAGHFNGAELEPLSLAVWSIVHGMCSLHIRQRVKAAGLEDSEALVLKAYDEFLKILIAK
jgi:AcrR family transcriptional regulator